VLAALANIFRITELRQKVLFTLAMFIVFRAGTHIPVPGVNASVIEQLFRSGNLFGLLDMFSGGALSKFSIFAMSITPYINASIILQLLKVVVPTLEQWSKEGEEGFKKIQYNRYADDFVIGVIGSKKDAEKIKEDVKIFLQEKLHLEMSEEKTKVTHSSKPVRYLGYDFKVIHSKNMKRCKNGDMKRVWYGKVFLYMPKEKWIKKAMERGAIQVKRNNDTGKEMWRPMPRKDLMNRSDAEIVSTFNSEIRGLYNFYRIAENVGALHKYYYMVRYSMLKTLAGKHRTNVSVIKKRHMVNGVLRIPYDTTKGRKYCEFYHDGFRKHSDGYDNVADVMPSYRKYDSRHTIVNRIKAGVCEICGEHADYLCMHHVRTLKSLKGRDIFEQKMLKMRRKSLALCPDCFELLHETKESR